MSPSRALPLRGLPALALLAPLLLLLPVSDARAQCAPDPASDGDTVTCDADDTDGFVAGVDNLDVTVQSGVTVSDPGGGNDTIDLDNTSTLTIEAMGAVTADIDTFDAISVDDGNTIDNQGDVTANGMDGHGIQAGNNNDIGNTGTITANGSGGAAIDAGDDDIVINDGTLQATGTGGFGMRLGDDPEAANNGTITNGLGSPGMSTGVQIGADTADDDADDEFTNVGSITLVGADGTGIRTGVDADVNNVGNVSVTGDNAVGVELGNGADLTNGGNITALGAGGVGVMLDGGTLTIDPLARITVDDMETAIQGGANVDTVSNAGIVTGNVALGAGMDSFTLETGGSVSGMLDGGADDDTLLLQGTGTGTTGGFLDLSDVVDFQLMRIGYMEPDAGAWRLQGSSTFANGVFLDNGQIQLNDTVTLGGSTDFTAANGTSFLVIYDPPSGESGHLDVGGAATLGADMELRFQTTTPIPDDTILDVLTAAGGITGTFAMIPEDTALLDFELLQPDMNTLQLSIDRISYGAYGRTDNQRSVASYLDRVIGASNGPNLDIQLAFLDLQDASRLPGLFDQLHPEAYDAHTGAMAAQGRAVARAAARPHLWCKPQMFELDPGPHRDAACGDYTAWLSVLLADFERDPDDDFFTSNGTARGILAGFDWQVHRRVMVTFYGGLTAVDLEVDGVGDGDIETYEMGAAVEANLAGLRARADFGYGRGQHEQSREIESFEAVFGANGEFNSDRIHAMVEVAYLLEWAGFQLEPTAGLDVSHVIEEAFDEDSSVGLGLSVDERSNTLVWTNLGARLRYRHVVKAWTDSRFPLLQGVWTPEVSAQWRATWTGADRELDARLSGADEAAGDFTVESQDSEQGVDVGGRLTFQPHGNGGAFSLWYDGYFGDAGTDHRFGGTLEIYF